MEKHKFRKVAEHNCPYPLYKREDGKYYISGCDAYINGSWKHVYNVYNRESVIIDTLAKCSDAKVKYLAM